MAAIAAQPVFRLLGAKDLGRTRRLQDREDAAGEHGADRRRARLAAARRRPHRRAELELLHPVGGPAGCTTPRRRRVPAPRVGSELGPGPQGAARQGGSRRHRRLLRGRLDRATLGRDSTTRTYSRTGSRQLLRLERGRLRLGRRQDAEHPVAARERRTRRRQPEGHRAARRHQQRRQHAGRRSEGRRHHATASSASSR